jgi:hypothetical protein
MVPMKRIWKTTAAAALVCVLAACSAAPSATVADASDIQSAQSSSAQTDTGFTGTTSTEITAGETTNTETTGDTTTETTSTATASGATPASGVAAVLAENDGTHDDAGDYIWDSATAVAITFDGEGATVDGEGAMVEGSTVTITRAGTYSLSGTLRDGQVVVDTADEEDVRLVLNGVALANSTSAPINVVNADDVVLILAAGTENTVSDATTYVFATAEEAPNAAIYSAADLSIGGEGTLLVQGNHNDAIASQDGLVIASGTITVNAVDDGIRGKDYLVVRGGTITVEAGGDGLKSDNAEDAANGYVLVEGGTLDITAGGDAVDAETDALIANGTLTITAGGGSSGTVAADASAKGIKGTANVVVDGGTLTIDTADDAVHSNGNVVVNGGTLTLRSGDDAMHGDATVTINAGEITVAESYEGIESGVITINDGTIHVTASDDAVNVAGGVDGSGLNRRGGMGGGDASTYMGEFFLRINGGTLVVDSGGDGLDANGAIVMTGGLVLVNGPTANMNGALDYDGGFAITGGTFVAAGSAGMAQTADASSEQNALLINYTATQAAGTLVRIVDAEGVDVVTFAPTKDYQSLSFSSPLLVAGATYTIYTGGSATGTSTDGYYQDASVSGGTEYATFTVSEVVTLVGTQARGMGRMRP